MNISTTDQDRKLAALLHIAFFANYFIPLFITGIIILIAIKAAKNNWSEYLNNQWREAINFNISFILYSIIFGILAFLIIGIPLLILLFIYGLVMPIIGAIRTLDSQEFRYPFIIRLV